MGVKTAQINRAMVNLTLIDKLLCLDANQDGNCLNCDGVIWNIFIFIRSV
jgi:hypothetical protein